jgi:hypothetical protein
MRGGQQHLGNIPLLADLTFANVFYGFEPVHALSPLQNIETMCTNTAQRQLHNGHRFAVVFVRHEREFVLMRRFPGFCTISSLRGHFGQRSSWQATASQKRDLFT